MWSMCVVRLLSRAQAKPAMFTLYNLGFVGALLVCLLQFFEFADPTFSAVRTSFFL